VRMLILIIRWYQNVNNKHDAMWLRWSTGCVLAFSNQVRVFKPGRRRRIFQGENNYQHDFLRRGSKAVCPMS
jgi:intein-encoded DNA endonuclease-like protein